ncbi:MAG: hypothetical protein QM791_02975 [Ferruginibacter sp.]
MKKYRVYYSSAGRKSYCTVRAWSEGSAYNKASSKIQRNVGRKGFYVINIEYRGYL